MNDTILVSKQTFRELIEQMQQLVKLLTLEISEEEKRARLLSKYDLTYLQGLLNQKIVTLIAIKQLLREAIITSSQCINL